MRTKIELREGELMIETAMWKRWLLLVVLSGAAAVVFGALMLDGAYSRIYIRFTFWGFALASVGFVSLLLDSRAVIRLEIRAHEISLYERGLLRRRLRSIPRAAIAEIRRVPIAKGYANLTFVLDGNEKIEVTQGLTRDEIIEIEAQVRASLPEPAYR